MAAHAVACDADSASVKLLERSKESFGELFGNVRIHVVALCPWLLGRIDVKAGARAEIVGIVLALNLESSYSGAPG